MIMFVYHYYAIRIIGPHKTKHIDGILTRETPISGDWVEYQKLKEDIGGSSSEKLVLCSLTLVSANFDAVRKGG
jgi:hypothetical protein